MDPDTKKMKSRLALLGMIGIIFTCIYWLLIPSDAEAEESAKSLLEGECFPQPSAESAEAEEAARAAKALANDIKRYYVSGTALENSYQHPSGCYRVKVLVNTGPNTDDVIDARLDKPDPILAGAAIELTVIPSDAPEEDVGDCTGQWFVVPPGDDEMALSDKP